VKWKKNEILKLKMEMAFRRTQILDDFQLGRISRAEAQGQLDVLEEEYCERIREIGMSGDEKRSCLRPFNVARSKGD